MRLHSRQHKEPDIAKYGPIGSPIPGSRFVRGYCHCCGEPMRITAEDAELQLKHPGMAHLLAKADCAECEAALHPGHGGGATYEDDEAQGGWDRAVKNYEGDHE